MINRLVSLQPAEVADERGGAPGYIPGTVEVVIDAVWDDIDPLTREAFFYQRCPRARRDGEERNPAAAAQCDRGPLGEVDVQREGEKDLTEDHRLKQVMDEDDQGLPYEKRREEWNLVHIVDYDIVTLPAELPPVPDRNTKIEKVPAPPANDPYSVDRFFRCGPPEGRAEERDPMPHSGDTRKNLVKMNLGAPGERVPDVLPVKDQNLHRKRRRGGRRCAWGWREFLRQEPRRNC